MKLTGKCLDAFWDKCGYDYSVFMDLSETYQNALIIEFFDSVGFHIKIYPHLGGGQVVFYPSFVYLDENHNSNERNVLFDTREEAYFASRTEATNAAIEKANELYLLNKC